MVTRRVPRFYHCATCYVISVTWAAR